MLGKLSQDKPRDLGRICFSSLVPSLLYMVKENKQKKKEKERKKGKKEKQ